MTALAAPGAALGRRNLHCGAHRTRARGLKHCFHCPRPLDQQPCTGRASRNGIRRAPDTSGFTGGSFVGQTGAPIIDHGLFAKMELRKLKFGETAYTHGRKWRVPPPAAREPSSSCPSMFAPRTFVGAAAADPGDLTLHRRAGSEGCPQNGKHGQVLRPAGTLLHRDNVGE